MLLVLLLLRLPKEAAGLAVALLVLLLERLNIKSNSFEGGGGWGWRGGGFFVLKPPRGIVTALLLRWGSSPGAKGAFSPRDALGTHDRWLLREDEPTDEARDEEFALETPPSDDAGLNISAATPLGDAGLNASARAPFDAAGLNVGNGGLDAAAAAITAEGNLKEYAGVRFCASLATGNASGHEVHISAAALSDAAGPNDSVAAANGSSGLDAAAAAAAAAAEGNLSSYSGVRFCASLAAGRTSGDAGSEPFTPRARRAACTASSFSIDAMTFRNFASSVSQSNRPISAIASADVGSPLYSATPTALSALRCIRSSNSLRFDECIATPSQKLQRRCKRNRNTASSIETQRGTSGT